MLNLTPSHLTQSRLTVSSLTMSRRGLIALLSGVTLLSACATREPALEHAPAPVTAPVTAQVRNTLAPTGTLRVAVYVGSPTSMVIDARSGQKVGVAVELGREMAQRLGVPLELKEFQRVAEVLDALKTGQADFTFTNATAERAQLLDFTAPLVDLELGYLVPATSPLQNLDDIDQAGRRVGVSQGSSSQGTLTRSFKQAQVVPVASLKAGAAMLTAGQLDAFATNKAVLFEMADSLPGARVLSGRWGLEHLAMAVPKGREAGLAFVREMAHDVQAKGQLAAIITRAGLRGTAQAASD